VPILTVSLQGFNPLCFEIRQAVGRRGLGFTHANPTPRTLPGGISTIRRFLHKSGRILRRSRVHGAHEIFVPLLVNLQIVAISSQSCNCFSSRAGFIGELLLVTPEKRKVAAINLLEAKDYAEICNRKLYPQIEKIVNRFLEGIPIMKELEAKYFTSQKVAFAARVLL
jgi:hypothetical protein